MPPAPSCRLQDLTVEASAVIPTLEWPNPRASLARTPIPRRGIHFRGQRNQAPSRQDDLEFTAKIGQGFLLEVRKLQGLLSERDEEIKMLETERFELYKLQGLLSESDQIIGTLQTEVMAANSQVKASQESEWLVWEQNRDLESRM